MRKILLTSKYLGKPWDILQSIIPDGFKVESLKELTSQSLLFQCKDADYLLVSGRLPIDENVLSIAKKLKMIQRTGVGTEMLDLDAIKRNGIPLYVNKGINARSVAEHTLTLILCCLKRIPQIDRNMRNGIWKKQQTGVSCHELFGKTVGLVGMGAIGRQVAKFLRAFGAKVLYTDLYRLDVSLEKELSLTFVATFEELLPQVDILSLHCPLVPSNKEMLNARTIAMMKNDSIIINTARGKLIDPNALYDALSSGHIKMAGLDTHYEEPIKDEYILTQAENVILTPHIGGLSYEAFTDMLQESLFNIATFEKGNLSEIEHRRLL